jgi:hypothetical protein
LLEERTVRRVTPALFVLAIVCFFFTFAGVSCNTDQAKTALQGAAAFSNGTLNVAELDRCLDALNGDNLYSYSGFDLAFGGAPSALTSPPAACGARAASLPSSSAVPPTAQAALGVQPLQLVALVAIVLGVVTGLVALVRPWRPARRALGTSLLAVVALALLAIELVHAHNVAIDKISTASTGAGVPFSISQYIDFNIGIAFILALAALAVVALYNLAAALYGVGRLSQSRPPPASG